VDEREHLPHRIVLSLACYRDPVPFECECAASTIAALAPDLITPAPFACAVLAIATLPLPVGPLEKPLNPLAGTPVRAGTVTGDGLPQSRLVSPH